MEGVVVEVWSGSTRVVDQSVWALRRFCWEDYAHRGVRVLCCSESLVRATVQEGIPSKQRLPDPNVLGGTGPTVLGESRPPGRHRTSREVP